MNAAFEKLSAYPKIAVWVLKGNDKTIRFYEKYGFRFDGEEKEIILGTSNTELRMLYKMEKGFDKKDYTLKISDVISHYDSLINQDNDPVHDPEPLKAYMDKWDGDSFIEKLYLEDNKKVLEIGVGTGRLAVKTAPLCKEFYGIDISPKTIERAKSRYSPIHPKTLFAA